MPTLLHDHCLILVMPLMTGALIWHGRDLRRYRRLLSPPLQRLLTCPGTAALGRGVAAMPTSSSVSPASALAHLSSDAVRAAAESPFLEGSLADASAVLCCIALPTPPGMCKQPLHLLSSSLVLSCCHVKSCINSEDSDAGFELSACSSMLLMIAVWT